VIPRVHRNGPGSACCLPRASRAPFRVLHERPTSSFPGSLRFDRSRIAETAEAIPPGLTEANPSLTERVASSTQGSIPALLGASHPSPALRPEGQGVELERPGFLTRSAPCLPCRVEVLFQTGNTLGVAPPTPADHSPPGRNQVSGVPGRIRRPFPAVARWRLPTPRSPRGLLRLPAGRVGVATTLLIQFSMSAE
jgi:hypothetical protein